MNQDNPEAQQLITNNPNTSNWVNEDVPPFGMANNDDKPPPKFDTPDEKRDSPFSNFDNENSKIEFKFSCVRRISLIS